MLKMRLSGISRASISKKKHADKASGLSDKESWYNSYISWNSFYKRHLITFINWLKIIVMWIFVM